MKIRVRTLLLVPVVVALWAAPGATAQGRIDQSFGESGIARVAAPATKYGAKELAIGPEGRAYVLDGSLLIGFESDGEIAASFGEGGKVPVAPASGEGEPTGLAVDSQGRILVAGTTRQPDGISQTYVVRFLPDGSRDLTFGDAGEVDTDFGLTAADGQEVSKVYAAAIIVDAEDRPVIGGSFATAGGEERCGYGSGGGPSPFVARLTAEGALDGSFDGSGNLVLGESGGVGSLDWIPGGGFTAFGYPCSTPPRFESRPPNFTSFGEGGETDPVEAKGGLGFSYLAPVVDPRGRILDLEGPPPAAEGDTEDLARYLPDDEPDSSFGRHGRVRLRRGQEVDAIAADAESRPLVAMTGPMGVELQRFLPNGKLDRGFGPHGQLTARVSATSAIVLDSSGRIYTLSVARNGAMEIARFIPGR